MSTPTISIIVPVYNAEKYLNDCIKSITSQSFSDFELILVPGTSTDNSTRICEHWKEKDNRIQIVIQDKNNCAYARNKAIRASLGKYICFCDADDIYNDGYLQKMYDCITQNDADLAECMFNIVDEHLNNPTIYSYLTDYRCLDHSYLERQGAPAIWKYISKRALWEDNNIVFPEIRTASDLAVYSLLWACSTKTNYLYEPLYSYRIINSSLSRTQVNIDDRLKNLEKLCKYTSNEFKKRGLFDKHRLTLISQSEHHLVNGLTDVKDSALQITTCQKLSDIIKSNFDVSNTVYDYSFFGWGGAGMHPLCYNLRKNPSKDVFSIKDMSFASLCDEDLRAQFQNYCDNNEHDIVIVDLISEADTLFSSLANLTTYIKQWAIGAGIFVSCIKKGNKIPKIILLKKYFAYEYIDNGKQFRFSNSESIKLANDILTMLQQSFLDICGNCIPIPPLPKELYISTSKNSYNADKYDSMYYYEQIVDVIHSNSI